MALLEILKHLKTDFNVTDDMILDLDYRTSFVANQVEEIKKILWREIVDYIIAKEMSNSEDDTIAMAGATKTNEKRANIRQFAKALHTYDTLLRELEQ